MPRVILIMSGIGAVLVVLFLLPTKRLLSAVAPTVDTATATNASGGSDIATFTLVENTTTTLYAHGQITDGDGCDDVAVNGTVTATFFRSNLASGAGCAADNNDCYTIANSACTKTNCNPPGDNAFNYECTKAILYYADTTSTGPNSATNWTATVSATDAGSLSGSRSDTIEMGTTLALDVTAAVSYGAVALGADSTQQVNTVINTGNSGLDLDQNADGDLLCTGTGSSNIAVGNVRYSLTSGFDYASGTALSTTATELELNLSPRTNDAQEQSTSVFFKLRLPSGGIGGICSNVITITAKADAENSW